MSADLSALLARPIAHRGLHDEAHGVIENSIGAAHAAVAAGYAIECDVQGTKDGGVIVFHDDDLDRLTPAQGPVGARDLAELTQLTLRGASEPIPSFDDFLTVIAGQAMLVVEIKSAFDGDVTMSRRVAQTLARYAGPCVIESFDPDIIAFLRKEGAALGVAHLPLGIVGEANYQSWEILSPAQKRDMTHFLHYPRTRPDFLSWNVDDLPHAVPALLREAARVPVTTWTVRRESQARHALEWTDQIVFEGFRPK